MSFQFKFFSLLIAQLLLFSYGTSLLVCIERGKVALLHLKCNAALRLLFARTATPGNTNSVPS